MIIITRYIRKLRKKEKIQESYAKIGIRAIRAIFIIIVIVSVLIVFDITVGAITGIAALFGGTILGFAAINTLGNAIAGLIVMISKPFNVGDRILFKNELADVNSIELMYTKLKTLDNAIISVPNQELLTTEIINYGHDKQIRQTLVITLGYDAEEQLGQEMLMSALNKVEKILKNPAPTIQISDFQNFAVEYTVRYFIKNIFDKIAVDGEIKSEVLKAAKKYDLDLSTPNIVQSLKKEGIS
jgi:small conductance mechanosensitive channel